MKKNIEKENKKITIYDLRKVFLRSNFIQGSWNFERMQALGFCFSIMPIIKKLYPINNNSRIKIIQRHLEFFNTHPYLSSIILGITIAMEESNIQNKSLNDSAIRNIKISLMGPLAGIGDPIFWGAIRPLIAAIGAGIAITGNILGPLIFLILFNLIRLTVKYYGIIYGYKKGINIIKSINVKKFQKIQILMSIVGLFIMGSLVSKWSHINISLVISEIYNQEGNKITTTVQNFLDQLLPGIIPMLLTFLCMKMLNNKINPLLIMIIFFVFSILGYYFGILGL